MKKLSSLLANEPLPFGKLSPPQFERMCLWLVKQEGYLRPQHYGEVGKDQGRDVIGYKPTDTGEELWYFQCKRYKRIDASTLKKEVDKYSALAEADPAKRPVGIVFVTNAVVSSNVRDDVSAYCQKHGYAYEFWAHTELDMRVKKHTDIVEEFFYDLSRQEALLKQVANELKQARIGEDMAESGADYAQPGGTLSPGCKVYVRRAADASFERELLKPGNIIVIRGNVEMGKSSLLASGLAYAEKEGRQIIRIDFQGVRGIAGPRPKRADDLFRGIATNICLNMGKRLDPELPIRVWDTVSARNKLLGFVKEYVLAQFNEPVVLAMDEVNRILNTPLGNDFRALMKTWQDDIATNQRVWNKVTVVLVFSTEPYLLADDITPLQWTIGTKIEVREFNQEEIQYLNHQYGNLLAQAELQGMAQLLGGHPYLTHTALHEIAEGEMHNWQELDEIAIDDERSPFKDHLIRRCVLIRRRPELEAALRQIVQDHTCCDQELFLRLQAAGLVRRMNHEYHCRYQLYERYFGSRL